MRRKETYEKNLYRNERLASVVMRKDGGRTYRASHGMCSDYRFFLVSLPVGIGMKQCSTETGVYAYFKPSIVYLSFEKYPSRSSRL